MSLGSTALFLVEGNMSLGRTALFLVERNLSLGSTVLFPVEGNLSLGFTALFLVEGNLSLRSTASLWSGICHRAAQLGGFVLVFCGGEYVTRPLCCVLTCGCIMIATKFYTAAFHIRWECRSR